MKNVLEGHFKILTAGFNVIRSARIILDLPKFNLNS